MRKYLPNESCCGAVYDNAPADNPFLAALPEMLPRDEFLISIRSSPGLPHNLAQMSPEERRQSLPMLASLFVPTCYRKISPRRLRTLVSWRMATSCGSPGMFSGYMRHWRNALAPIS